MRHLERIIVAAGIIAAALSARSDHYVQAQEVAAHYDTLLLGDFSQATAEFGRRLRERVTAQDGMILVTDPELSVIDAFPASVAWSLTCGRYFGLSLTFGSGTSEQGGITSVELSRTPLTQAQCRELVVKLGSEVAALLSQ